MFYVLDIIVYIYLSAVIISIINAIAIHKVTTFHSFIHSLPSMFSLLIIFSYYHVLRVKGTYENSDCDQKEITLYRNFFRNLNFKNIVNFLREHI